MRGSLKSFNYIDSHDGYTLYDQVVYANDGQLSWNCGAKGDAGAGADVLARRRQAHNFLALLLMSNGTPTIRMGDEFLRTQDGNANPYNVDNATTWIDWDKLSANADMFRFTRMLIAFSNAHPTIWRSRFWGGDVSWYGPNGKPDESPESHTIAYVIHGTSVQDKDIYVLAYIFWKDVSFTLQEAGPWHRVIDTGRASPDDIVGTPVLLPGPAVLVAARSVLVAIGD